MVAAFDSTFVVSVLLFAFLESIVVASAVEVSTTEGLRFLFCDLFDVSISAVVTEFNAIEPGTLMGLLESPPFSP